MSRIDVICDSSYKTLSKVPKHVLQMSHLKMLYLEGNHLTSLPENFFEKLSKLSWLDLRSNQLLSLPTSLKFHAHLENLLLQNNRLVKLPNELGLVPNLKVLQLSGNPLQYPSPDIIDNGVHEICTYLKQEYDKLYHIKESKHADLIEPEKIPARKNSSSSTNTNPPDQQLKRRVRKKFVKRKPALTVKSLSKIQPEEPPKPERTEQVKKSRKVHKISADSSRISVRSHYNSGKYVDGKAFTTHEQEDQEKELKDVWLNNLKDLLQDQEKIIQQERNLKTLSTWRLEKKKERPRENNIEYKTKAPYAVETDKVSRKGSTVIPPPYGGNVEELINSMITQLSSVEKTENKEGMSSKKKLQNADKEIRMVMDLHKKIRSLQEIQ